MLNKEQSEQLPRISQGKNLKQQVDKLIKNKIEPLALKHYVLKTNKYAKSQHISSSLQKQMSKDWQKSQRDDKENNQNQQMSKQNIKNGRRKAVVHMGFGFGMQNYKELQSKVEHHIMLKKILMMENQYTFAEECSKDKKAKICKQLWTSPMQKYLSLFQKSEALSEKVKLINEASCEQILRHIKSAKSLKNIQCLQQNMKGLWNYEQSGAKTSTTTKKQIQENANKKRKKNQRRLKRQIISDIKKDYQVQGSSKIRININHKKMIQII